MNKLIVALCAAAFSLGAIAADAAGCEEKAMGKNGKPLAGAAKKAFMKKCAGEGAAPAADASGCAGKAVGKNGKPLAGAAKKAFMKKCEADAKGA